MAKSSRRCRLSVCSTDWKVAAAILLVVAAAGLFAKDAVVIQDGQRTILASDADALAFNASLPCGAKVVGKKTSGDDVTTTFTLTRRPGHMCDGTGEAAVTVFTIVDGKITLWHQLPSGAADLQSA